MSPEMQITEIQKLQKHNYNFDKYRYTNYRNTKVQITGLQKFKLTNYKYGNKNHHIYTEM